MHNPQPQMVPDGLRHPRVPQIVTDGPDVYVMLQNVAGWVFLFCDHISVPHMRKRTTTFERTRPTQTKQTQRQLQLSTPDDAQRPTHKNNDSIQHKAM